MKIPKFKGLKTNTSSGWHGESGRHKLAAKVGSAGPFYHNSGHVSKIEMPKLNGKKLVTTYHQDQLRSYGMNMAGRDLAEQRIKEIRARGGKAELKVVKLKDGKLGFRVEEEDNYKLGAKEKLNGKSKKIKVLNLGSEKIHLYREEINTGTKTPLVLVTAFRGPITSHRGNFVVESGALDDEKKMLKQVENYLRRRYEKYGYLPSRRLTAKFSDRNMYSSEKHELNYGHSKRGKTRIGESFPRGNMRRAHFRKLTAKILDLVEINKRGTITEQEVKLLQRRLKDRKIDYGDLNVLDSVKLTPEHTQKGFKWLMNQWKSPRGVERKNNPFGFREQSVLENFKGFIFDGFYDAANYHQSKMGLRALTPLWRAEGKNGETFQYYVWGGKINIVG